MARKLDVCESCQTNSVLRPDHKEKDLQRIFRKLRVNNSPKKLANLQPRIKSTRTRTSKSSNLPEKLRKRKILRDPTFVFTSNDTKLHLKGNRFEHKNLMGQSELEEPKATSSKVTQVPPRLCMSSSVGGTNANASRIQGCGEQFRNQANIKVTDSLNMDDTTPEELAAYFDQLLHIPKPMSQMAEMMYT